MKKILILALSMATMLSVASCQKTEMENAETNVTIEVGMPVTKAISDGTTATKLLYEVYYKNANNELQQILKSEKDPIEKKTTMEFTLMRGSSYVVLFWAQADGAPYGTENLQAVQMNYTANSNGNNEDRDAFCGKLEFTVSDTDTENEVLACTLVRPFSQLNFVSNDYTGKLTVDKQEVATMTLTKSEIAIANLATVYNVLNGTASGSTTDMGNYPVTFTATTGVDDDENGVMDNFDGNTDLHWVSMNYILVPSDKNTINLEARFTVSLNYVGITDPVTNQPITVYQNSAVPVAPNYRTNLVGDLFTEDGEVSIEIDPKYATPDNSVPVE